MQEYETVTLVEMRDKLREFQDRIKANPPITASDNTGDILKHLSALENVLEVGIAAGFDPDENMLRQFDITCKLYELYAETCLPEHKETQIH